MSRTREHTGPERGGVSSSASKEALKRKGEPDKDKKRAAQSEQEHQDDLLDQALMESFPGSDPVALTEPARADPPKKKKPQEQE